MADTYYDILGVAKDASQDDIKKAYRKLAHQHHPDRGGDEAQFKKVSEAYSVLSNAEKRRQYDMFGASGAGGFGGGQGGFGGAQWSGNFEDLNDMFGGGLGDIFEQMFGGAYGGARTRSRRMARVLVSISLQEAFSGVTKDLQVELNGGRKKVSVAIPAGIDDGQTMKVERALGEEDLYVQVRVTPHKDFARRGNDIYTRATISVAQAALGDTITVRTLGGEVSLKVPAGIQWGDLLRLQGKGMPTLRGSKGDQYVKLEVEIPKKLSKKAKELFERLGEEL